MTTYPTPATGGGIGVSSIDAIVAIMDASGIPYRVTSTYRDTSTYHGSYNAVDFAGPTPSVDSPELDAIARFWATMGPSLLELIYAGPNAEYWKNGQRVSAAYYGGVLDSHHNHVHVAATLDGLMDAPSYVPLSYGGEILPPPTATGEYPGTVVREYTEWQTIPPLTLDWGTDSWATVGVRNFAVNSLTDKSEPPGATWDDPASYPWPGAAYDNRYPTIYWYLGNWTPDEGQVEFAYNRTRDAHRHWVKYYAHELKAGAPDWMRVEQFYNHVHAVLEYNYDNARDDGWQIIENFQTSFGVLSLDQLWPVPGLANTRYDPRVRLCTEAAEEIALRNEWPTTNFEWAFYDEPMIEGVWLNWEIWPPNWDTAANMPPDPNSLELRFMPDSGIEYTPRSPIYDAGNNLIGQDSPTWTVPPGVAPGLDDIRGMPHFISLEPPPYLPYTEFLEGGSATPNRGIIELPLSLFNDQHWFAWAAATGRDISGTRVTYPASGVVFDRRTNKIEMYMWLSVRVRLGMVRAYKDEVATTCVLPNQIVAPDPIPVLAQGPVSRSVPHFYRNGAV